MRGRVLCLTKTNSNNIKFSSQIPMGYYYNSACSDQTCSANCCNYYGICPDYYSLSTYSNQCWYWYSYYEGDPTCSSLTGTSTTCCYSVDQGYYLCNKSGDPGSIIGGSAGGVVGGIILIVLLIVYLCKKYRNQGTVIPENSGDRTMIIGTTPNINYGPPPNISFGPSYGATPTVNYGGSPVVNFDPNFGAYSPTAPYGGITPIPPYMSMLKM